MLIYGDFTYYLFVRMSTIILLVSVIGGDLSSWRENVTRAVCRIAS